MKFLRIISRHLQSLETRCIRQQAPFRHQRVYTRIFSTTPTYNARRGFNDEDDQFETNVFEEEVFGRERKRRRLTDDEMEEEQREDEESDNELIALEKDLKDFKVPDEEEDELVRQVFTEEELKELEEEGEEDDEDLDIVPYQVTPQTTIPRQSQVYLKRFNAVLDEATMEGTDSERIQQEVWRLYSRSKDNIPAFTRMIPKEGWELIWATQATDSPANPDRIIHLKILTEDKESAGWQLSQEEKFIKIEGMFLEGGKEAALELLEESLQGADGDNPRLMEMGVRMYSLQGKTEHAQGLLDRLFALDRSADPRVMTSLIGAHADRQDETSLFKAWSLFQELQRRLSSDIQMRDYDTVSLSFLEAGHKDFALAVFRDMMLHGQERKDTGIAEAFSRLGAFVNLTKSSKESTEISLDAIKYLPRQFQNKYFYASWLRKLLAEDQLNSAAQVVELMYERGVRPDAKHINGLISSFLRSDRNWNKERGEELGWTMIQRRLEFCRERRQRAAASSSSANANLLDTRSVNENSRGVRAPVSISRPVPVATIETFCILLQFYLRRGLYDHVRHLRDLLGPAELSMNSFFMNHLLYADMRTKGHRRAWQRFETLTQYVHPDMESWACLWECEKRHVHDVRNIDFSGFPMPRELLTRMLAWFGSTQGQEKSHAYGDIDQDQYHNIVRCFCLAKDPEGCFVAMHTFNQTFGLTPTAPLLRSLLMMMTKLLPPRAALLERRNFPQRFPRRQRAAWKLRQEYERDMAHATYLLDTTRKERVAELQELGVLFEDLGPELQAQENHKVCLGILLKVMDERRIDGRENFKPPKGYPPIQRAAQEMGLEKIDVDAALKIDLGDQIRV